MFSLKIKGLIRKWVFFSLSNQFFSSCWDRFIMQGNSKGGDSHLGLSGSPKTGPGQEGESTCVRSWGQSPWVPEQPCRRGRHMGTWDTEHPHELPAYFFLKEKLSCHPVVSCILRASPFLPYFTAKSVCCITKTQYAVSLSLSLSIGASVPTPVYGQLAYWSSLSQLQWLAKSSPKKRQVTIMRETHFLFSLILKYVVLLGHSGEAGEGASVHWAPTVGQALLSTLYAYVF